MAQEPPKPSELMELMSGAERSAPQIQIPSAVEHDRTASAQRYLHAAHGSVRSLLVTMQITRGIWKELTGKDPRGRLHTYEIDMLRAAIVFATAGLDASLKELIRNTLIHVNRVSESARKQFSDFVKEFVGSGDFALKRDAITEILTAQSLPRNFLLQKYVGKLTGDSLQSCQQVDDVCSALGITDKVLRSRCKQGSVLDAVFKARNQIIHEFDLEKGGSSRSRRIGQTVSWATEALSVAQEIINQVGLLLGSENTTGRARLDTPG